MDLAQRVAAALGVDQVDELAGGHQSRVFRVADRVGLPAVAKVLAASMVDRTELDVRLGITLALAEIDPRVCRPLLVGERQVMELSSADGDEHYVVCYEFANGSTPDPAQPADAERMGAALSQLHMSMSQLPVTPLPLVHALRATPSDQAPLTARQLLHGDFSASNLRQMNGVVRIFDLDDCGYGPPAFDVANALYMVLFDASVHGKAETYESFRRSFLDGYASVSGPYIKDEFVERFVDLRVLTLRSWLDDLDTAPIGVRTASPAWQATLRSFVSSYRPSAS